MDGGTSLGSTARERAAVVGLTSGVDRPVDVEHALEERRGLAGAGRMHRHAHHGRLAARFVMVLLCGQVLTSCATRVPIVTTSIYPSYPFPSVPPELAGTPAAAEHERAWSFLQAGHLEQAERGFAAVLRSSPEFHPSAAGLGYVGLARGEAEEAVARFDQAIAQTAGYVPALLGRGEALLVADRVDEAVESFQAALAVDPGLPMLRQRVEVLRQRVEELRFRGLTDQVARARAASAAGRNAEARASYERVIAASPESGFLYIELAEVERRQGDTDAALERLDRAVELDPGVVAAWMLMFEIHLARGDLDRAEQAMLRVDEIDPTEDTARWLTDLEARRRVARLPPEYREIVSAEAITRGQLAAMIGARFESLLADAAGGPFAIITDARDHWALGWVMAVVQAGIMKADANYRFRPERVVTRAELAQIVVRLLRLPAGDAASPPARPRTSFSDLAPDNLLYSAASEAVAAGVLPPLEQNAFRPSRPVSGAEAMTAVDHLDDLVGGGR